MASSNAPGPSTILIENVSLINDDPFVNYYRDTTLAMFEEYRIAETKELFLWEVLNCDFGEWTNKSWNALRGNDWLMITNYCLPHSIWINNYGSKGNRSKIMMRIVTRDYENNLKKWDLNRIADVEKRFKYLSIGLKKRRKELLGQNNMQRHSPTENGSQTKQRTDSWTKAAQDTSAGTSSSQTNERTDQSNSTVARYDYQKQEKSPWLKRCRSATSP